MLSARLYFRAFYLFVFSAIAFLALSGCQTYTAQTAAQDTAVRTGSLEAAVTLANQNAEANKDKGDAIVYRLEQGAILRQAALSDIPLVASAAAAAKPVAPATALTPASATAADLVPRVSPKVAYARQSLAAFDTAEERINAEEEKAKISAANELFSSLTNLANLPYRGYTYDKVMLNTYKALNYLQLGQRDAARVELNRVIQRQTDAVAQYQTEIERASEAAQKAKDGKATDDTGAVIGAYDVDKAKADPKAAAALGEIDKELAAAIKPYGDYMNPFAVLIDGLFFLSNGEDASDFERARKSMERLVAMAPDNPSAKADFATAEAAANGQPPAPATYVIFETGAAPSRDQTRIDIPLFLLSKDVPYVGVALPRPKYHADFLPTLKVTAGDQILSTALVSSMDSVVSQEFKNGKDALYTRTIISTVVKAVALAQLKKKTGLDSGAVNQLGETANQLGSLFNQVRKLAGDAVPTAVGVSLNIADTRTWRSLPKEFHYLRLPTPADRKLTLSAGAHTQTIEVEPGIINVIYVKSTSPAAKLLVHQFALKADPAAAASAVAALVP
jgi:uncharacterized protein